MVALSIFGLVLGGILMSQIAGMRLVEKTQTGLEARGEVQRTMNLLIADVRAARSLRIGVWTNNVFLPCGARDAQQGSAIRLYPSAATNHFIQYHWDGADQSLKRLTNGGSATLLMRGITNSILFRGEDFGGRLLTNAVNNFSLGVGLRFEPKVNPMQAYDTRITRRTLE
jgi:hypothetical protein